MRSFLAIVLCCTSLAALPAFAKDGADPQAHDAYAGAPAPAMNTLRSIRAFAAQQRARHGGELRDWDREAINLRLDALEAKLPTA